jgi:hypothetical protein
LLNMDNSGTQGQGLQVNKNAAGKPIVDES